MHLYMSIWSVFADKACFHGFVTNPHAWQTTSLHNIVQVMNQLCILVAILLDTARLLQWAQFVMVTVEVALSLGFKLLHGTGRWMVQVIVVVVVTGDS